MGVGEVPVLDGSIVQLQFSSAPHGPRVNIFRTRPRYCYAVSSLIVIFLATDFIGMPVA